MAENDVSAKVLEQIRVHGPLKAKKIADALGIDRAEVNRILHGQLRGKVKQDNNYNWSLAERIGPDLSKKPGNSRENLFAYYLDCVAQDDDSGVRTFADSKYDLDYVELEEWPLEADRPNFQSEPLRKLIGRQRREARKKALWLGYPVRLRQVRSPKGWEGASIYRRPRWELRLLRPAWQMPGNSRFVLAVNRGWRRATLFMLQCARRNVHEKSTVQDGPVETEFLNRSEGR